MGKRKDIRSARSQYFIRKALVEMLEKKTLADLSVAEIAEKAEVSRRTFYIYYENKTNCLVTILKELLQEIFSPDPTGDIAANRNAPLLNWQMGLRARLDVILKNRILLQAMFRDLNTEVWISLIKELYDAQTRPFWDNTNLEESSLSSGRELCQTLDCMQLAIYLWYLANANLSLDNAYDTIKRMLQLQKERRLQWEKELFGSSLTLEGET